MAAAAQHILKEADRMVGLFVRMSTRFALAFIWFPHRTQRILKRVTQLSMTRLRFHTIMVS